jgi:hypothetical protein
MSTISITIPSGQDARVASAVGERLGLVDGSNVLRPATGPEIKQYVMDQLKNCVLEVEQYRARNVGQATVTPITPA